MRMPGLFGLIINRRKGIGDPEQEEEMAIKGIDLGTTNTLGAVWKSGVIDDE